MFNKALHFITASREILTRTIAGQKQLLRFGPPILLISKFVPGLDAVAPPLAGTSRTSRARFLAFDVSELACMRAHTQASDMSSIMTSIA